MSLSYDKQAALKLFNPEIEYIEIEEGAIINYGFWCLFYKWRSQRKWRRPQLNPDSHPYQVQETVLKILGKKNVSIH